jgi:hypothetical protein
MGQAAELTDVRQINCLAEALPFQLQPLFTATSAKTLTHSAKEVRPHGFSLGRTGALSRDLAGRRGMLASGVWHRELGQRTGRFCSARASRVLQSLVRVMPGILRCWWVPVNRAGLRIFRVSWCHFCRTNRRS